MSQDLISSPWVSLHNRAWACSQHGGWVPRVSIPREQDREVHEIFMTQPQNSHASLLQHALLLVKAVPKVHPFQGKGAQTSPCYEECEGRTERASGRGAIVAASLENTICPTISSVLAQAIKLGFSVVSLNFHSIINF